MIGLTVFPDLVAAPEPVAVVTGSVVGAAARAMVAAGTDGCAIIDADGAVVGMLGGRRILALIAAGDDPWRTPVEAVMTVCPDRLAPGDCPLDVMALFEIRGVDCLPVVDDGRLVAVVTLRDLQRLARREIERGFVELQRAVFGDA
jgi:CBS domain-containing protein